MRVKDVVGEYGETVAAEHLVGDGMRILDRRWRCSLGEVDIVAADGDCLVVCEVKTRRSTRCGLPLEAVTRLKLPRLRRLAAAWLAAHDGCWPEVRIDVVAVLVPRRGGPELDAPVGRWPDGARPGLVRHAGGARRAPRRRRGGRRPGLPAFTLIGLPDASLDESRDRVRAAAANAGCPLPPRRITVNLAPAALPKTGTGFDLAVAVALLAATDRVTRRRSRPRPRRRARASTAGSNRSGGSCPRSSRRSGRAGRGSSSRSRTRRGRGSCPGRGGRGALARRRARAAPRGADAGRRRRGGGCRPGPGRRRRRGRDGARAARPRATSSARPRPGTPSRSQRRVGTTCSCSAHRAPARRCSQPGCPACSRTSATSRRSR